MQGKEHGPCFSHYVFICFQLLLVCVFFLSGWYSGTFGERMQFRRVTVMCLRCCVFVLGMLCDPGSACGPVWVLLHCSCVPEMLWHGIATPHPLPPPTDLCTALHSVPLVPRGTNALQEDWGVPDVQQDEECVSDMPTGPGVWWVPTQQTWFYLTSAFPSQLMKC